MWLPKFIKDPLDKRIQKWMVKRSTVTDSVTLTQRRIYIFLSKEGILYGALLLITFIAGVNYANNLVLGLCFYLASVLVICIHYTYAQLSGLQVKLLDVSNAEMEDCVKVRIQLSISGSKPHRQLHLAFKEKDLLPQNWSNDTDNDSDIHQQKIRDMLNKTVASVTVHTLLKPQIITFYLPAFSRGKYVLPKLTVNSVYPLGVLKTWTYILFDKTAWIWPKPLAFPQYGDTVALASSESRITGQQKGQDDFDRLDKYKTGEPLSRVSWRHLASGKGMLTKHFADPVGKDILLDYGKMPASNHESKLSQLSFAVQELSKTQTPFEMVLPQQKLELNTGKEHEATALLMLAKVAKQSKASELGGEV